MNKKILLFALLATLMISVTYAQTTNEKSVTMQMSIYSIKSVDISFKPDTKTMLAGSEATYTATIKNLNPVAKTFQLSYDIPDGWTATVQDSVQVPARGSAPVSFKVTSAAAADLGTYQVTLKADDGAGSSGSGTASYIIDIHGEPTVSIAPVSQEAIPGKTASYTVTIKNNDLPGLDPSRIVVTPIVPDGWTGRLRAAGQDATSLNSLLSPGSTTIMTLDVTSPKTATDSQSVGVSAAVNTLSAEAYAEYKVTLCGDGICQVGEECAADCGNEDHFSCSSTRCESEQDAGVLFSSTVDFSFTKFLVCKGGTTTQQCEAASNCGINSNCLCKSAAGVNNNANCYLRCVDNDGSYYLDATGLTQSQKTNYVYSFHCPDVNLQQIKDLLTTFTSSLNDYDKSRSALTEVINTNPDKKANYQPCVDAYTSIINDLNAHTKFLQAVINNPAKSNTTDARTKSDTLKASIDQRLVNYCLSGTTGLLKIDSVSQPDTTEIRTAATGTVVYKNTGSVTYYGYAQCDFSKDSKKLSVNQTCGQINSKESRSFNAQAIVDATGNWTMTCRVYGSLNQDCSAANLHDISTNQFVAFTKDIYVKDAPTYTCGNTTAGTIECRVRVSGPQSCATCAINDQSCSFVRQENDVSIFNCPFVTGNFTLTGTVTQTDQCTPVDPKSKTAAGRCSLCGDGFVDKAKGEDCELPDTQNNPYVKQQSGLICNNKKSGVRDEYGYCTPNCKASPDVPTYTCTAGTCGAECSDSGTVLINKTSGNSICTCVAQCGSDCTWDTCNCEPSTVYITHVPSLPTSFVSVVATTASKGNYAMNVYVDNIIQESCSTSPCVHNDTYGQGTHTYYVTLAGDSVAARDPVTGTKSFVIGNATNVLPQKPTTAPVIAVSYSPPNPLTGQQVTIFGETDTSGKIDIYVSGIDKKNCTGYSCSYTSLYAAGNYSFYATLTTASVTTTGIKNFTVTSTVVNVPNPDISLSVSVTPADLAADKLTTLTAVANASVDKIEIFVDGTRKYFCGQTPCSYTDYFAAGNHSYYASLTAGSVQKSTAVGSFFVKAAQGPANATASIISAYCTYNATTNRYSLAVSAVWSGPVTLYHGHIEIDGDMSPQSLAQNMTFKKEMAGPGTKLVDVQVHDVNHTVIFMKSQPVVCGAVNQTNQTNTTGCQQTGLAYAINQATNVCNTFPSSCVVPTGWLIVSNCPQANSAQPPAEPGINYWIIIAALAVIAVVVVIFFLHGRAGSQEERLLKKIGG